MRKIAVLVASAAILAGMSAPAMAREECTSENGSHHSPGSEIFSDPQAAIYVDTDGPITVGETSSRGYIEADADTNGSVQVHGSTRQGAANDAFVNGNAHANTSGNGRVCLAANNTKIVDQTF